MLDLKQIYSLSHSIVLKSLNNHFWILDILSGKQYKLNAVSFAILEQFGKNVDMTLENILLGLSKQYKVEQNVFVSDSLEFLEKCFFNNFIVKGGVQQ